MYDYHWEVKVLDGKPAYTDEEAGTIIDKDNFQGMNHVNFEVPATAS